jgi:hypothetical protein
MTFIQTVFEKAQFLSHTKYTFVSITKTDQLMLLREIITVSYKNYLEPINAVFFNINLFKLPFSNLRSQLTSVYFMTLHKNMNSFNSQLFHDREQRQYKLVQLYYHQNVNQSTRDDSR